MPSETCLLHVNLDVLGDPRCRDCGRRDRGLRILNPILLPEDLSQGEPRLIASLQHVVFEKRSSL